MNQRTLITYAALLIAAAVGCPALVHAKDGSRVRSAQASRAAARRRPTPGPAAKVPATLDFERDVRPILSENCFACHGFDANKRMAGLRLDVPDGPFTRLPTGHAAVMRRRPDDSALVRRIAGRTMPPPAAGKRLTDAQIGVLRRWVEQGAPYEPHWAFVAPKRPPLPVVKNAAWCRNPIDRFILARLEKEGLRPSPEADRATLIRRVTLDLTGLPPSPAEVDAFLADRRPGAYERLVDRLLASPHYGERLALQWLDVARYADTHGFHIDSQRDMWPWREWVIDSYNRDLPYDKFAIQQLAGDLLPNATQDQKVATGFNRNHPINFEGGAIPEEYAAVYVHDRIDTTATAFLGLTLRCGQCHDHKFDPLTQKDYYHFFAFFNSVPEAGLDGQKGNAVPFMKSPTLEQAQQLKAYDGKIAELDQAAKTRVVQAQPAVAEWEKKDAAALISAAEPAGLAAHLPFDELNGTSAREAHELIPAAVVTGKPSWKPGKVSGALEFDGATHLDLGTTIGFDRRDAFSYGAWVKPVDNQAMAVLSRMDDADAFRGWDMFLSEGKVFAHLIHHWEDDAIRVNTKATIEPNQWHHLFVTYDGSGKAEGVRIYINGKSAQLEITHNSLKGTIRTEKPLRVGGRNPGSAFRGLIDEARIYRRALSPDDVARLMAVDAVRPSLAVAPEKRTAEQKEALARYYLEAHDDAYRGLANELAGWRKKRDELDAAIPTTMVMQEMDKPRETFMLLRGQYDKKGEKVTPGTPAALPPMKPGMPPNRLGLAQWLVDLDNPLTARVAVNRCWQLLFGNGIVKTVENFGTQGDLPTHPELLDWLAVAFGARPSAFGSNGSEPNAERRMPNAASAALGWSTKALVRLIVTSATYRQSSRVTPQLLQRDPENLLLARGPRFRLPGELIRDQALAISGLLVPKIGGPSVKPYQPPGLWEELAFGGGFSAQTYVQDHGEALYRRSMYSFWKRTCPPPSLQTFDAPEREFCMVRRSVTNTPLQALVLMNDPTYVEASRRFAERIVTEAAAAPRDRVRFAFRCATCRYPKEAEAKVLLDLYNQQLAVYKKEPEDAKKLLSVGESPRNEKLDVAELAAWTSVASVILNLDEVITKG